MKALVSSSHHILSGIIGIGFWQSFSKAKSTLPLHCVKISIAFNVVASRVAKKQFYCYFVRPVLFDFRSEPEVGNFAMKPTIFRYQMMGMVSQSTQNVFLLLRAKFGAKNSRFHDKKSNFRFRGSDRKPKKYPVHIGSTV